VRSDFEHIIENNPINRQKKFHSRLKYCMINRMHQKHHTYFLVYGRFNCVIISIYSRKIYYCRRNVKTTFCFNYSNKLSYLQAALPTTYSRITQKLCFVYYCALIIIIILYTVFRYRMKMASYMKSKHVLLILIFNFNKRLCWQFFINNTVYIVRVIKSRRMR
jgi:hypothetical protein